MQQAEANLEALGRNPYPGRGIILGVDQTGSAAVQVYWIMGRSANSRNRVFMGEGGRLWTEAADPSLVKDPSLIIYTAMDEVKGHYVVTNGDQTDTITEAIKDNRDFEWALMTRQYEPDAPNFTPRISGLTLLADGHAMGELAVLKHSEAGESCNRNFFTYEQLPRGLGYCVTTYQGDGDPLPSFAGEPYLLPLAGDASQIAQSLWDRLNAEKRVSLAVKWIDLASGRSSLSIINQYRRAE